MKTSFALPFSKSVLLIAMSGLLASCEFQSPTTVESGNKGTSLPFGKEVVVQFKRDALGAGTALVPPETEAQNGSATMIRGKLVGISEGWLEIQRIDVTSGRSFARSCWIPKESVLLILDGEIKEVKP